eukprot:3827641-Prymnesium_polylepis.2
MTAARAAAEGAHLPLHARECGRLDGVAEQLAVLDDRDERVATRQHHRRRRARLRRRAAPPQVGVGVGVGVRAGVRVGVRVG